MNKSPKPTWPESLPSDIIYGASSIGSINSKFLASFWAAAGKKSLQHFNSEGSDPEWGCWNAREELKNPSVRIIFPTIERVKSAYNGILPSRHVLCFSEADSFEWEKKLQEGEERLAKGQRILNEKEQRANENDLEEAQRNIDATNVILRSKEDEVTVRLANITLKEKECDTIRMNIDLKEKELSSWKEKLNTREKIEIQKLLDVKKQELEVELDEKRKAIEEGLQNRLFEVENKEAQINHTEEKVAKREQALEKKAGNILKKGKITNAATEHLANAIVFQF
ncbi:hypothetical protein RIF29_19968 [Crotalaria pallida]|uniref:Uncharacterized protein n=1 Tax=Crotalaria pallida TaxID=3830 RepID=A0AAN9F0E5_CROPI